VGALANASLDAINVLAPANSDVPRNVRRETGLFNVRSVTVSAA
jgi:hypothetical protein